MVKIDRHEAALPLYHHDYTSKTQAIRCLLNKHRGLYINANYLGGVSIRDRILQANITAGDMLKWVAFRSETEYCKPTSPPGICSNNRLKQRVSR